MHPLPDRTTDPRAPAGGTGLLPPATGADARMTVEITPDGTVAVGGEIDSAGAPRLYRSLRAALVLHPEGVRLDLGGVTFCDCAGLRALLTARAAWLAHAARVERHRSPGGHPAAASGTPLLLGPTSPRMARLLRLTGTGGLFLPPRAGRSQ
ncbi:STAS domain-containing protein [Streptomyces sp. NPDC127584]|uniref:STAS domain-containing protein n=1 Tax=Streptomyces sp. NPDC127584 TaxID=3345403 RepID=UPI00363010D5